MSDSTKMFYCGCRGESGHYLWDEHEQRRWHIRTEQPWGDSIDTGLCPAKGIPNGVAKYTRQHGWSAVSWWDNSVDSRPGSHSTFVAEGIHQPGALLEMARKRFPWVFARFGYEVAYGGEMSIEVEVA